jgi:ribosomal protein S12 methylthiotransferase
MEVQAEISREKLRRKVGRTLDVIVDEVQGAIAIARSAADAPEIDGVVRVKKARSARPGEILRVRINASTDHDLEATLSQG